MFETDALNSSTSGAYVDKNDSTSTPGTRLEAADRNITQNELVDLVESSNQTINTSGNFTTQIPAAIANYSSGGAEWYEDTGTADDYELDRFTSGAGFTLPSLYFDGMRISFLAATTNTGASVVAVGALADTDLVNNEGAALSAGDIVLGDRIKAVYKLSTGDFEIPSIGTTVLQFPRGFIDGLILSNAADTDHDITVAIGKCKNAIDTRSMSLAAAITKQIDANWTEGTNLGGFPSGLTLLADTWYNLFLISKADGTTDAGFDTSLTAVNLLGDATGYTSYRRIGSVLTDGSLNVLGFSQEGDSFLWDDPPQDVSVVLTATASLLTLSVPPGVKTITRFMIHASITATNGSLYLSSPDVNDELPIFGGDPTGTLSIFDAVSSDSRNGATQSIRTNTSSQIRGRVTAPTGVKINTQGWLDLRGKE